MNPHRLALTQGDPVGIGPEILLRLLVDRQFEDRPWTPLLIAERAALEAHRVAVPGVPWGRLVFLEGEVDEATLAGLDPEAVAVVDPLGRPRSLRFGEPTAADAKGALAALDRGVALVESGLVSALVTAPINKEVIARHVDPSFVGHTDYLAAGVGLEVYGRDYLMTFLAPDLRVALLTVHCSLTQAIAKVRRSAIVEALHCLDRHLALRLPGDRRRIVVAALNPHVGEGGLLGNEDDLEVRPAVEQARREGIDVRGPESADSLFARTRQGEFDWVLALYHDQGLIAVKTAAFGEATNWTLGLPYLRTSVDHGTAYGIAGQGVADVRPMQAVVSRTLDLLASPRI